MRKALLQQIINSSPPLYLLYKRGGDELVSCGTTFRTNLQFVCAEQTVLQTAAGQRMSLHQPLQQDKLSLMNLYHKHTGRFLLTGIVTVLFLYGCGNDLPVEDIVKSLRTAPSYSILLEDMEEEGNFFKSYFHKYRIVQENKSGITKWLEVPKAYYMANEAFLGMVIAGKTGNEIISSAVPAAYQYVGNNRYGRWRDDRGRSLWEFDRGSPLFEELDIDLSFPIYRKDYKAYKRSKSKKVPFFGTHKEYGTRGSVTKKKKPGFFERHKAREQAKKTSFAKKVGKRMGRTASATSKRISTVSTTNKKTGRTRTGFRSRSGGRGK